MTNKSDKFLDVESNSILNYRSADFQRYSLWVYDDANIIRVFPELMPNTIEIWFEFYDYTHLFWKMMEHYCIDANDGGIEGKIFVYNLYSLKEFCLRYLLRATNYPVELTWRASGQLSDDSYDRLMSIHPRIWRALFDKYDVLGVERLTQEEELQIAKECAILYGKGEGVTNPHRFVTFYSDMMAFWDKFGLNYFDTQRLPQNVYSVLKKMMSLEAEFKSKRVPDNSKPAGGRPNVGRKSVTRF